MFSTHELAKLFDLPSWELFLDKNFISLFNRFYPQYSEKVAKESAIFYLEELWTSKILWTIQIMLSQAGITIEHDGRESYIFTPMKSWADSNNKLKKLPDYVPSINARKSVLNNIHLTKYLLGDTTSAEIFYKLKKIYSDVPGEVDPYLGEIVHYNISGLDIIGYRPAYSSAYITDKTAKRLARELRVSLPRVGWEVDLGNGWWLGHRGHAKFGLFEIPDNDLLSGLLFVITKRF